MIIALALLAAAPTVEPAAASPTVEVRTSRVGSLVHHVMCLARTIQCQNDAYERQWQAIGKDKEDDKAIEAMKGIDASLRRRHFGLDPLTEQSAFPLPARDYDGHRRLRAEAFMAADLAALKTSLAGWLTPEDSAKVTDALARLEPRFAAYWKTAGPALAERQTALKKWQSELDRFSADAHHYLQSDFAGPFVVYLVDRPAGGRESHAERLTDVAFVEVASDDNTFDVARAALVQLVKTYYAAAPTKTHKGRQRAMSSIESDALLAAYTLLDDVLAYGLTGSVLAKRLQQKSKSRTSPVIERLVTKLSPLFEATFDKKVLDGRLASEVAEAIIDAEAKELSTPRMALRFCEVAYDRTLTDARRELTRALMAEQVVGYAPLDTPDVVEKMKLRHTSYMSVVWLVKPDELSRLAVHKDFFDPKTIELLQAQKSRAPFAFGVRRPVPTPAYIFVASTTDEFKDLFKRFAALPKPFLGVMPAK